MNLFQISAIIVSIISAGFGLVVLLGDYKSTINRRWFSLSMATSLWGLSLFGVTYSTKFESALFWQYLLDIGAILIPIFNFNFIINLLKMADKQKKMQIFSFVLAAILIGLSFTTLFKSGFTKQFGFYWVNPGVLYFWLPLIFAFYILYTFFLLITEYFKVDDIDFKKQIKYICIAQVFGFGGGMTNFFPQLFDIYPFGNYLVVFYWIFISYIILKHHLFNIKVIATELLTFAVWIAILVRVFLADTWSERFMELGFLAFIVFFGILIIRSVIKEVQTREKIQALALELKGANDKLKEMDQIKSDFVTIASHQLRTPLTAIKGYASLMLEGSYGKVPEKMKDPLNKLFRSSERMVVMVGDFLNVSRIERGKIDYEFTKFDVLKIVKELFEEFKLKMEEEKKTDPKLYFDTDVKGEVMINADEGKIKQVLSNLIDNSIKYTPVSSSAGRPSGFVKIIFSLPEGKNTVLVSIKDSGTGMSEETLGKIFEKFNRAKDASKFNTEGSGLGLYVAKEFIAKHNGRLWAESAGEGKGSTFFVELPKG